MYLITQVSRGWGSFELRNYVSMCRNSFQHLPIGEDHEPHIVIRNMMEVLELNLLDMCQDQNEVPQTYHA